MTALYSPDNFEDLAQTPVVTLADTDYALISDTSDSGKIKRVLKTDFGSGGSASKLIEPVILAAGDLLLPMTMGNDNQAGETVTANMRYLYPFNYAALCDALAFHTGATGVVGNAMTAIYRGDGEYVAGRGGSLPKTRLRLGTEVSTAGNDALVISNLLSDLDTRAETEIYWCGIIFSAAASIRPGLAGRAGLAFMGAGPAIKQNNTFVGLQQSFTYDVGTPANNWPATLDLTGAVRMTDSSPPMLALRAE